MATQIALTKELVGSQPRPRSVVEGFLEGARLFESLKDRELHALTSTGSSHRVGRGHVLYWEDEPLNELFLVRSGSVKLVRNSEDGKEFIVHLVAAGECFGAMARPLAARSLARTLETSLIQVIPLRAIRRAAEANPTFALALLEVSEKQCLSLQTNASGLAFDSVPRRLARILLDISDRRHGTLSIPLNQTELANLIGSSRETVCSTLSRFSREGMLTMVKGRIHVRDRNHLASVR